ncbi:Pentatricopeptide repeat-containing protein [Apostasia shenzhenica]|uniref:Pentatricopeptide repeat-containing protein n=1 Tax=Apostasia shenzhenica TaxID=1088818 RepID=A0A2I0BFU5_9ASPA|nr:Pentatricopeptide repeat-containing protein [Apostasia shenzhenica]
MASRLTELNFCSSLKSQETHLRYDKNLPLSSSSSPASLAVKPKEEAPLPASTGIRNLSVLLKDCTSKGSLLPGKAIHAMLIRNRIETDIHIWDCIIEMYVKLGSLNYARRVFDEMPQKDAVSWTSLASGYAAGTDDEESLWLLCAMQREGIHDGFAISAGLKTCSSCLNLDFGRQLHGQAIKMQLFSDFYIGSGLVDLYVKCGETEQAERAFLSLPRYNVVSLNALLNGYARTYAESKVLRLFQQLEDDEMRLNEFLLSIVLRSCTVLKAEKEGRALHCLMIKVGLELDGVLACNLIDLYAKCGCFGNASKVFYKIKNPDLVIWSSMISCLDQQGLYKDAVQLFNSMRRSGIKANQVTLATVASVASEFGDSRFAASIHSCIIKSGLEGELPIDNAVLDMYMRNGAIQDGCIFFDYMKNHDVISWNGLLSGFHSGDYCREGLRVFGKILMENFSPNKYSFISVLRSCTSLTEARYGSQVHAQILKRNLGEDSCIGKALVDMYVNCRLLREGFLVFDKVRERDVFSWSVIISGFVKEDLGEDAIKCYRQMLQEGVEPNEFALASCLKACSDLASLDTGKQLHSCSIKSGLSNAFVSSSLVNMYVKCGCLNDGEAIFSGSDSHDLVLWNTIIFSYSQHGYAEKALEMFEKMIGEGVRPDQLTFVGVLSACGHAGLLEEGKKHFEAMSQVYRITPTIKHYQCMISILGRAGKHREVEYLIDNMKITPDSLIWQTVLAACRVHGNLELGERAAERLFKLEPNSDAGYIMLSNIYANLRRWDDVARVRKLMASCGVKKEPGCSWIQVNGQVHVFLTKDISHPMFEELSLQLHCLKQHMMQTCHNLTLES